MQAPGRLLSTCAALCSSAEPRAVLSSPVKPPSVIRRDGTSVLLALVRRSSKSEIESTDGSPDRSASGRGSRRRYDGVSWRLNGREALLNSRVLRPGCSLCHCDRIERYC